MSRRGGRGQRGGGWQWLFGEHHHGERSEPWGWRGRFFEAGEVRLALLSLLKERPKHGYELMKEIEQRSGGLYKASAGTIYPNLQQLEDEGLIKADQRDDGKRVYSITDEGRAALEGEGPAVERIWSRASNWGDWGDAMGPAALEVMGPAMRVIRGAFRAASRGNNEQVERVRGLLNRTADELDAMK